MPLAWDPRVADSSGLSLEVRIPSAQSNNQVGALLELHGPTLLHKVLSHQPPFVSIPPQIVNSGKWSLCIMLHPQAPNAQQNGCHRAGAQYIFNELMSSIFVLSILQMRPLKHREL